MTNAGPRVIIGASDQEYPGWIRTQESDLRLHVRSDWEQRFAPASISHLLAEHVWEHLDPAEARESARIVADYLVPGGRFRVAVPDGLMPNEEYQRNVQVGGPGPADHPAASHKVVYDYRTIAAPFIEAGLDVTFLEWWDERGAFHAEPWDSADGFIYRSIRFDHRNTGPVPGFTSLIVDVMRSM